MSFLRTVFLFSGFPLIRRLSLFRLGLLVVLFATVVGLIKPTALEYYSASGANKAVGPIAALRAFLRVARLYRLKTLEHMTAILTFILVGRHTLPPTHNQEDTQNQKTFYYKQNARQVYSSHEHLSSKGLALL